ncbi:bifunctional DNA-formamidopyrimidine glycosylase/DNA-(apurinic or apyrimidinic site) lyase [Azohydromonas sediminis]|uniref:bifunctional DNA-formamidopyrimidine glycosylase/DNA-(apurinic or apyrimidinic site) lyase n=1 Tax=Azohydromonas sediminis TaxID=2259674 RepID=UPI000E64783C|nr:bifunctional DNA-formamidopyrimidine glycosylase/DNA-(apurinic or apyrimidinic site) lyase [Azohydromonas sediminis]
MPEMPEVEVTRRSIAGRLDGARITGVRLGAPLRWPLGTEADSLVGCHLGAAARRGKYLWLPLAAGGRARGGLLVHLGMSGSLALLASPPPAGRHDHVDLVTDRGTLRLTDPRRFGAVVWAPALDAGMAAKLLAGLGAEPFDPTLDAAALHAALRQRRAPIKPALLAGDVVVGAGNIYACEALFDAGIDPRTPCRRLGPARCARLLASLRRVLARAIELGGSTLRDFRDAHGAAGAFQAEARVYGREGQPCTRCGATVRRIVQAQRSTYFCPRCQHG